MPERSTGLFGISDLPFRLVFIMWLSFTVQFYTQIDFYFLGVKARSLSGLVGILLGPLIHSGFYHIFTNSLPILFLGTVLFFFYNNIGNRVFMGGYFFPNVLVWIFSPRETYHIGASGMVYALASFLILFGLLWRDFWSLFVSVFISAIYWSIFWYGLIPQDARVSWEAHAGGAISGIALAIYFYRKER